MGWFKGNDRWAPSHNGGAFVCLHKQIGYRLVISGVKATGLIRVAVWLPSQNGCCADLPQAHHR
jgi:hypothetical protein